MKLLLLKMKSKFPLVNLTPLIFYTAIEMHEKENIFFTRNRSTEPTPQKSTRSGSEGGGGGFNEGQLCSHYHEKI